MNYDILHNWMLLRALLIFGMAAVFLVFAGIVARYDAWRDSRRSTGARPGKFPIPQQGAGNTAGTIA